VHSKPTVLSYSFTSAGYAVGVFKLVLAFA
jgi:hypothetical protein